MTITQNVRTRLVLTAVLVNKVSMEMEHLVKVCESPFFENNSRILQTDLLYPFLQILMSVLRIPVRVMKTLIVPTVTVLTAVLVTKDLLEMEQFVKVKKENNKLIILIFENFENKAISKSLKQNPSDGKFFIFFHFRYR